MNTTQAKFLAKKFGCRLTFIDDDKPGMWFLTNPQDTSDKACDNQFCFTSGELKNIDATTLVDRIAALIS